MSYIKATDVLPEEILLLIQQYVDGEYLYIPRKETNKKSWGENTNSRKELSLRNSNIYNDYRKGLNIKNLSSKYFLSEKSIQRIIRQSNR
ncbi:CD3324 family protein [Clostridium cellulovorans]|uniref:Mor transcription activator domain protein n=1 Tax=Clostridium cellulovorans (strain ATCC 35296 / DSM 3052 / OCM 3 / 743B) TaxID=573061 RepID=D9SQW6_CLOC7|nr:CD3324 family protein [Clostridium cellulovorans]ADL50254.1 Mor transcription activator domain protein [Clostridium cellulovorans 743B]